jgi:hypothetical protein
MDWSGYGMVWIGLVYDEVSRMISVVLGDGSLLSKRAILSRSRNAEIDRNSMFMYVWR